MAERFDLDAWQQRMPSHRDEWAKLAADLDVRVMQISERDTQRTATPNRSMPTWRSHGTRRLRITRSTASTQGVF